MRKSALIFDHDGTLVDSIRAVEICTNSVLKKNGYSAASSELISEGMGYVTHERFGFHSGTADLNQMHTMAAEFYTCMHTGGLAYLQVYEGVQQALDALAASGYSMGMVSNNQGIFIRKAAAHLKYAYDLEIMLGEENIKAHKPAPDGLLQAAAGLAALPEDCWYIGDTYTDYRAAKAAGMKSGLVSWGTTDAAVLSELNPDALFYHPDEMKAFFLSLLTA